MSNTRQYYMFQQTYILWWWNSYIGVYITHAWTPFNCKSRALETRKCDSWQLCVLQLKPLKERRAAESHRGTEAHKMRWWQGNNWCGIKDPLHIFTRCTLKLMCVHHTNDNLTGGKAKIWNSEKSQKLRWDRCWFTKSLSCCLNRKPGHCTQHGI